MQAVPAHTREKNPIDIKPVLLEVTESHDWFNDLDVGRGRGRSLSKMLHREVANGPKGLRSPQLLARQSQTPELK